LLVERRIIEDGQGRRGDRVTLRGDRYGLAVQFDVEGPERGPAETAPRASRTDR
jgi:hypothetical protein